MSKKNNRRNVVKTICDVSPYEFEYPLKKLKEKIEEWINEHGEDAYLNWDPHRQEAYDPSPSPIFYLTKLCLETDAEYELRIKTEKERNEAQHRRDVEELERLKKKLGVE